MEVQNRSQPMCERPETRYGNLLDNEKCTWFGVGFALGGRHPKRLVASIERKTRRAYVWRLEFELMPYEEAHAFAAAITRELETNWGPPAQEGNGQRKWERSPFFAEANVLCENMCEAGERWQVWVLMDAYPTAGERDEADISPY
jgi:hypothetical protein